MSFKKKEEGEGEKKEKTIEARIFEPPRTTVVSNKDLAKKGQENVETLDIEEEIDRIEKDLKEPSIPISDQDLNIEVFEPIPDELITLDSKLSKEYIEMKASRDKSHFYLTLIKYGYDQNKDQKEEIERVKLGRISTEDYIKNKQLIEKLRKEGNSQELKKILNEYEKKNNNH